MVREQTVLTAAAIFALVVNVILVIAWAVQ
jgi:hypothetical protein